MGELTPVVSAGNESATSKVVGSLTPGTSYSFDVRAVASSKEGSWTNTVSIRPATKPSYSNSYGQCWECLGYFKLEYSK